MTCGVILRGSRWGLLDFSLLYHGKEFESCDFSGCVLNLLHIAIRLRSGTSNEVYGSNIWEQSTYPVLTFACLYTPYPEALGQHNKKKIRAKCRRITGQSRFH